MHKVLEANRILIRELKEKKETVISEIRAKRMEKKDIEIEIERVRKDIRDLKGDWRSLNDE